MKNDIKNIQGEYAGKLFRAKLADEDTKRRIVINAKVLYKMLNTSINYKDRCEQIEQSPLRENIDYKYTITKDTMLLSVCAMQAILVMHDSQKSWHLYNAMTDLIHNGFSSS